MTENITQSLAEKEYESLRKEIADSVAETRAVERYAVLASAGIWTWLLAQPSNAPWIGLTKFIPFTVSLFAAARSAALYRDIMQHAEYIRILEQKWGRAQVFFWETFLKPKGRYLGGTSGAIWVSLVLGNLVVALCLKQSWFTPTSLPK